MNDRIKVRIERDREPVMGGNIDFHLTDHKKRKIGYRWSVTRTMITPVGDDAQSYWWMSPDMTGEVYEGFAMVTRNNITYGSSRVKFFTKSISDAKARLFEKAEIAQKRYALRMRVTP